MSYKVLSIDFDYFQSVHLDTITACYPDGIDVDTKTSIFRWLNAYEQPENAEKMKCVIINQDEINLLIELLLNQRVDCPVMVTNSHKNIYDFVNSLMRERDKDTRLYITNVDMHHDMINDNHELDCGNWITHFAKIYSNFNVEWIANPMSKEMYGFSNDEWSGIIKDTLKCSTDRRYDAVFLCRSDPWFPPHLDNEFDKVLSIMRTHFTDIVIEKGVEKPRVYTNILRQNAAKKTCAKAERV